MIMIPTHKRCAHFQHFYWATTKILINNGGVARIATSHKSAIFSKKYIVKLN